VYSTRPCQKQVKGLLYKR